MFVLTRENSIAGNFLAELRDKDIQKDRMKFRFNMERLGSLLAYEISKSLKYQTVSVETDLGIKSQEVLDHYPNLITVLRAGLPFFEGFLHVFHKSDCGFLGAYRSSEGSKEDIEIEAGYFTSPDLSGKDLIIVDPMLATGKSFVKAITGILKKFRPKSIHIASLVSSLDGIEYIRQHSDASIWTVDLDDRLNEYSYIVPGLGDAGDLSYGKKV